MRQKFEFSAKHLNTPHHSLMYRRLTVLLNTHRTVALVPFPEDPAHYVEPTVGQLLAIKAKDKQLFLQQDDGSYKAITIDEDRRIHRCPVPDDVIEGHKAQGVY